MTTTSNQVRSGAAPASDAPGTRTPMGSAQGELDLTLPEGTTEFVIGADGSRLRTLWAGSGPSVVLAHGYLLDLGIYAFVFRELVARGNRVIAFDQRGHGASSAGHDGFALSALADDYAAILEHFDVTDGQLVAHSMGSFLGLIFCMEYPALVQRRLARLIVLGGNAGAVAKGSLPNRLQIPLLKSGVMPWLWRSKAGPALVSQLFGPRADPRLLEFTLNTLLRQDVRASLPVLEAMIHKDYYGRLHEVRVPTKVLCGTHDRTCPRWHSERLAAELPNASNTWLEGVGHMVTLEAPAAVVDAILT